MGDIYREVKLWGLDAAGKRLGSVEVMALLDSGATLSVIGKATAAKLRGLVAAHGDQIEGRFMPTMNVAIKVNVRDCGTRARHIVVSDTLVARAGRRAQMILGTDYMQRTRLGVALSTEPHDEGVACRKRKPPKAPATRGPRAAVR